MLDIQFIYDNPEKVKKAIKDKGLAERVSPGVVDKIIDLDERRRKMVREAEEIRRQRNDLSRRPRKAGQAGKLPEEDVNKGRELRERLQDVEPELKKIEESLRDLMLMVPAVPHSSVPVGKSAKDNKQIRKWGVKPDFDFKPRDHIQLGEGLGILDLDRGTKVAGFRGYYLKNEAVIMQLGLMRYGIDKLKSHGFELVMPPVIVHRRSLINTGHFPWGEMDIYKTFDDREEEDGRYLAGTAEVPLVSYHQDEILDEAELPKKYAGFSSCYRREIGSYGKDTRGLYRVHEFVKIEQVIIDAADEKRSLKWLEDLVGISEEMMQELELPYRVLLMSTSDMGEPQWKKYDIETWMPSRNEYGETHSASAMLDFQSRRAGIRYRAKDGATKFVHMLNNTMVASPRILIALWENHQQKDGSIKIPAVLRNYVGFESIKSK